MLDFSEFVENQAISTVF